MANKWAKSATNRNAFMKKYVVCVYLIIYRISYLNKYFDLKVVIFFLLQYNYYASLAEICKYMQNKEYQINTFNKKKIFDKMNSR